MSVPAGTDEPGDIVKRAMMAKVAEVNARIATCHERVACPTCKASVGMRCVRVARHGGRSGLISTPLKHPHEARWTQETPKR